MTAAHRIAHRYLNAAATTTNEPEPIAVILTSDAVVTTDDIEMVMAGRGISVSNVLLYAAPDVDGANVVRWTGVMPSGELLRGTVSVKMQNDAHRVSVKLIISVAS